MKKSFPSEDIRTKLTTFCQEHIEKDGDVEKTRQYYEMRRSTLYYDGKQYLVAQYSGAGFDFVPVQQVLSARSGFSNLDRDDFDTTVANVYKGDVRKFVGVIGQKSPNINCVAASKSNPEHQRRASSAEFVAAHLHSMWDIPFLHMRATHLLAVNSTVFFYTPWSVDPDKYGVQSIPKYATIQEPIGPAPVDCPDCGWAGTDEELMGAQECPQCGSPNITIGEPLMMDREVEDGEDKYPRGGVECHVLSALEVTIPFRTVRLEDAAWLSYSCEMDRGLLMSYYPEIADKIRNGSLGSSSHFGRTARAHAQSYTKTGEMGLLGKAITYTMRWLRTHQFELFKGEMITLGDGRTQDMRDWLYQECPDGVKLCFVGDYLVSYANERLDDVWSAAQPDTGETMNTPAYMSDMLDCQDRVNDFMEQANQSIERSLSATIADPQVLDPAAVNQVGRRAGQFLFSKPGMGGRFDSAFYKLSGSEPRPEIFGYGQTLLEFYRQISGILPPIFGGGGDEATFAQAEMKRNQALMVLNTPWFFLRFGWAKAIQNGIKQICKHSPDGKLYYPLARDAFGEGVKLPEDYKSLLNGGWKCEADEAMPMTAAQVRVWMERLQMSENPEIAQVYGLFHPDNLGYVNDIIGISGWTIPQHKDMMAINEVINRLLQDAPAVQPDPMTGQPTELPSEEPDPYLHDPGFAAQAIREWLLSNDGKEAQSSTPDGWQNVYLYGKSLFQQTQMQQAPPPEEGGAPPPAGPPMLEAPMEQPLPQ